MRLDSNRPEGRRLLPGEISGNKLLKFLSGKEAQMLASCMESIQGQPGTVLFRIGEVMRGIYFPLDCIVSLRRTAEGEGRSALDVIGNEGFAGVSLFMGGRAATSTGTVLTAGQYFLLKAHRLREVLRQSPELERLLLRYVQVFLAQASWSLHCRVHHELLQRVCTCILLSSERLGDSQCAVTAELVERSLELDPTETGSLLRNLQALGYINVRASQISIAGRPRLESMACRCYKSMKQEWRRVAPAGRTGEFESAR